MVIDDGEVSPSAPKGEVSWAGMASNSWWISPRHGTALLALTQHLPYNSAMQELVKPFFYAPFLKEEEEGGGGEKRMLRGQRA